MELVKCQNLHSVNKDENFLFHTSTKLIKQRPMLCPRMFSVVCKSVPVTQSTPIVMHLELKISFVDSDR
jgi:hypothetical protein